MLFSHIAFVSAPIITKFNCLSDGRKSGMTREEIESVGFEYGDLDEALARYPAEKMKDGWNIMPDGEEVYYISNPALGLWAHPSRFVES